MISELQRTEIGEFPVTWKVARVDSAFDIQQGKQVSKKNREGNNQLPFLRTKNVLWNRLDLSDLDQMNFTETEEGRLEIQHDDLLVCEGGSIGRTALWNAEIDGCLYQNHLHRLRVKGEQVEPQFGVYWFWYAFDVGKLYFGRGNVTTIPNLSRAKLAELPMVFPSLLEQKKIAYILSTVQQAIEAQERLIQTTTELKKALMHKLFTEGLRNEPQKQTEIGPIPESWKVVPLEQVAEAFQYGTSVKCGYEVQGKAVLRIPNVVGGDIDIGDLKYGSPKPNEIGKLKLQSGDLLFVRTNGVKENAGRCSLFQSEIEDCYYASYLIRVRLDPSILNPMFLNEYSRTETGISFLSGKAIRTADGKFNINSGTLKTMLVPLPVIEEQQEIAKVLSLVDTKFSSAQGKKSTYEHIFRTVLHELMTAKIRVHDLELHQLATST
ncbi:MAG: restriction endonuclease subunit S [Gammaproteobacteria bacterium]|nr:restriction endonuclease subunit S [Gammaproteobacteria bacterium]